LNCDVDRRFIEENPEGLYGLLMKIFKSNDVGFLLAISTLLGLGFKREFILANLNEPFFHNKEDDTIYMDDGSVKVKFQNVQFWFNRQQSDISLAKALLKMVGIAQKTGQSFVPFKVITDEVCFIDVERIQDAIDTHKGTLTYEKWRGEWWMSFVA